jgi:tetratricopeptide (TPR) repeat protein
MADAKQVIQDYQQAAQEAQDDPEFVGYLGKHGFEFWDRFENTGQLADLDQAIQYFRQALDSISADNLERREYLGNLGLGFEDRFLTTREMADLEQSIQYHQQALEATQANDPKRLGYLGSLGAGYQYRFEKTGQLDDLHQCIQYYQQQALQTPADRAKLLKCLNKLGNRVGDLYNRTGAMSDLQQSIDYYQQALQAGPTDHPGYITCVGNLGASFADRFQKTGETADLDRSLQYYQQAFDAAPVGSKRRAEYLGGIGSTHGNRFERTGQLIDLEQSIQYYQQALQTTSEDYPDRVSHLSNLGVAFADRFRKTGEMMDLERGLKYHRLVLESATREDPRYAKFLNNAGTAYGDKFQRTEQMSDLDQCIKYHQLALDALPAQHPERARCLGFLGIRFGFRYRRTDIMSDLEQSIQYAHQAVESTPADEIDHASYLSALGAGLRDRFQKMDQIADVDESIKYARQAVEATPIDHPQRARYLFVLGLGFTDRFAKTVSSVDFMSSIEAFKQAAACSSGVPLVRLAAGFFAVENMVEKEKWNDAADTINHIIHLLPDVFLATNSRDDMQSILRNLSGLASLSASVFLKAGKPSLEALQALERARGVFAGFLIDARSDTSILKEKHPELWSRYTQCQQQIATINSDINSNLHEVGPRIYTAMNDPRQQLLKTLNSLREEIRQCPGFERFLLSMTETEIRDLARNGPVVCFNVSRISSEAFLIMKTGIQALPLPNLKLENIRSQVRLFASRGNSERRDATLCESDEDGLPTPSDLLTELRSLWNVAVKPVLQQAGLLGQSKPSCKLPRIWWVGGGSMALLPLHAAGDHTLGSLENTPSHAISSFAPTLRALQFMKNKPPLSIRDQKPDILVISMPTTPGEYKALNVAEEVESIAKYSGSIATITHLERPTREAVLAALKSRAIVHFACHGRVDPKEPARSALIVGQDTEETLTIENLDTITRDGAQIAYLSACSTAEIQAMNLVDESITLASTFQLAGFQHVIATLWGADDTAAVKIAGKFYEFLLLQRSENSELSVAKALHEAVLCFRNADGNRFAISQWAPFIHLGC